jgi:prophage tail gpP-like protein
VPGFRDAAGQLWTPNKTVFVQSSYLKIEQDMLIYGVEYAQDDRSGTTTTLTLVDPGAASGAVVPATKSDGAWSGVFGEAVRRIDDGFRVPGDSRRQ